MVTACEADRQARRCGRGLVSTASERAGAKNRSGRSCGLLIDVMEASKHWYCDDLSSLVASMRRACPRRAGCTLSDRTMRAPVVEIADILGQDLLQMPLTENEHVQSLGPDRSHPALGDGVGPRRSERRASLGNPEITYPPIEAGVITAVAVRPCRVRRRGGWQRRPAYH